MLNRRIMEIRKRVCAPRRRESVEVHQPSLVGFLVIPVVTPRGIRRVQLHQLIIDLVDQLGVCESELLVLLILHPNLLVTEFAHRAYALGRRWRRFGLGLHGRRDGLRLGLRCLRRRMGSERRLAERLPPLRSRLRALDRQEPARRRDPRQARELTPEGCALLHASHGGGEGRVLRTASTPSDGVGGVRGEVPVCPGRAREPHGQRVHLAVSEVAAARAVERLNWFRCRCRGLGR
mmetsp:Transcript_29607/g.70460  ORF Transcript_29607/g.70460 Transcript_29607/m.70460 type:complete len:235 (-) Transcript_29607:705-1409(-)